MNPNLVKTAIIMPDGGNAYTETNFSQFIVEPFNTMSAILFLFLAGYWYLRLRGQFGRYKFLTAATFLLTVGAVGGTVYHAFRESAFFMYMDWLPILLLVVGAAAFFVVKLVKSAWIAAGVVLLAFLSQILVFTFLDQPLSQNISYGLMAVMLILPLVIHVVKSKFYQWWWVVYAFSAFALALLFRILDPVLEWEVGSHFLWHVFGAAAGHFMFKYIFEIQKRATERKMQSVLA